MADLPPDPATRRFAESADGPDRVVLVLVDGMGMPPEPLCESVYGDCPSLLELLENHCVPLDACLGVPGIPQSATGHTTILTGINAPAAVGCHVHGFPGPLLRPLVEHQNLFGKLLSRGVSCAFADAYVQCPAGQIPQYMRSATTVAALSAFGRGRGLEEMLAGMAVYHDPTREWLARRMERPPPRISEEAAAAHLAGIVRAHRFTLYEFFLTDLLGHRGTPQEQSAVLRSLDRFIGALMRALNPSSELLLLVSDHGNIEEPGTRQHTRNPVPWGAWGHAEQPSRRDMTTLTDVTPRILELLTAAGRQHNVPRSATPCRS